MSKNSHCHAPCTSHKGFTLIEVLVCVAILASVVMSMFGVFTHVTIEIRRSRNRTFAAQAAQMVMETVIAAPGDVREFHGLTSEDDPPEDSPVRSEVLAWRNTFATFPVETSAEVSVTEEDAPFCIEDPETPGAALCPEILQVTVEIHYQDHGRDAMQHLSLTLEPRGEQI